MFRIFRAAIVGLFAFQIASAQLTIPSDGSDGALTPSTFQTLTLDGTQAASVPWNTPAPIAGKGVYDPNLWAVVYKFSSINIPNSATVNFIRNHSNAPIVFLVSGNVTIAGTITLSAAGSSSGPGGFDGGFFAALNVSHGAGFGPGGGPYNASGRSGGSHATAGNGNTGPLYSNVKLIPLIGGSGGSGYNGQNQRGGGGGGAILIAASGTVTINGQLNAVGGDGSFGGTGGSGGAIRLVCNQLSGTGSVNASGFTPSGPSFGGGAGRVRIEAISSNFAGTISPDPVSAPADLTPQIWPTNTDPRVSISLVNGQPVTNDPGGNMALPDIDFVTGGPYTFTITTSNIPVDGSWVVELRVTPRNGQDARLPCAFVSGNQAVGTWTVSTSLLEGFSALQVHARKL